MDSFMDICIQDGGLTAAGEHACALVYEHVTGKVPCDRYISVNYGSAGGAALQKVCNKPHDCYPSVSVQNMNGEVGKPYKRLAVSLDSWMPIWEAMGDELITELFYMRVTNRHILDPMWWLEETLRACGLYEKWRADNEQG